MTERWKNEIHTKKDLGSFIKTDEIRCAVRSSSSFSGSLVRFCFAHTQTDTHTHLVTWNPVKRLYHFDFGLSNVMCHGFGFRIHSMAITHAHFFCLYILSSFSIAFIVNMSFNSKNRTQAMCKQAFNHLPKSPKGSHTRKMSNRRVFVPFFVYHMRASVSECVSFAWFVWVDLDNSNKLNGMQSL